MNRLNTLIENLCPNGVPYLRLDECCILEKGKTPIQKAIPGEYPLVVTTSERKSSSTYQFDKPAVCVPLVSSRGHGVACLNQVYYQEGKFALGSILCGVTPHEDSGLSTKFLFYYLNLKKDTLIVPLMKGGANVSLTVNSLKTVKVAIPPLEIQNEIVVRLQKFEELLDAFQEELSLRRKQYEHYRDVILSFNDTVPKTSISNIAKVTIGEFVHKNEQDPGAPYPVYNGGTSNTGYYNDYNREANKIIISARGANAGYVNRVFTKYWSGNSCYTVDITDPNLDWNYVYFWLKANEQKLIGDQQKGGIPAVSKKQVECFMIAVPELEKQKQIVSVLEIFEKICGDTTNGILAEIEVRQNQYKYYRDKLLTFKEA